MYGSGLLAIMFQLSYIPQTEQRSPFRLMLLCRVDAITLDCFTLEIYIN